jgi:hypothetical protein
VEWLSVHLVLIIIDRGGGGGEEIISSGIIFFYDHALEQKGASSLVQHLFLIL